MVVNQLCFLLEFKFLTVHFTALQLAIGILPNCSMFHAWNPNMRKRKFVLALIYEDPNKLCSHVHFALKRVALVCLLSNWRMFFPKWREDFSEADAWSDILFVYYYIYGICRVNKKAYKKGFHKSYSMLVYNKIWFQVKSCDLLFPEGQGKLSMEMHCMAYKRHWFGVPMNACTNLNSTVELISIMHLQSLFF